MEGHGDGQVRRTVTVFWDYENQSNPKAQSFQHTCNRIRTHLLEHFDRVTYSWVFLNTAVSDNRLRAEICNAGCNIVDCAPSSLGKTAQVDQRIIVSLLSAAFVDSSHAVCLISADGDYCHVLNLLRNNRVYTSLLYNTHGAALNPMCANSVDLCLGLDFRLNNDGEADDASASSMAPDELLLASIRECAGITLNSHKDIKLAATVGTIFHAKLSARVHGVQDRKRAFANARSSLVGSDRVKIIETNSTQYFQIM